MTGCEQAGRVPVRPGRPEGAGGTSCGSSPSTSDVIVQRTWPRGSETSLRLFGKSSMDPAGSGLTVGGSDRGMWADKEVGDPWARW